MSTQEENIEDYLLGRLAESKKAEFEGQLKINPALQLEVEQTKAIYDSIELDVESELRRDLSILATQNSVQVVVKSISTKKWMLAAALIAAVMGASIWMMIDRQSSWNDFVTVAYAGYDFEGLRSVDESSFSDVLRKARSGDHRSAIQDLTSYLALYPEDYEGLFLRAHMYQQQGNPEQAREAFRQLTESQSKLWAPRASWNYLVLSLPNKWDDTAKKLAEKIIANENHPYHKRLPELLEYVD